jgi:hypothetical protein
MGSGLVTFQAEEPALDRSVAVHRDISRADGSSEPGFEKQIVNSGKESVGDE